MTGRVDIPKKVVNQYRDLGIRIDSVESNLLLLAKNPGYNRSIVSAQKKAKARLKDLEAQRNKLEIKYPLASLQLAGARA